MLVLKEEHNLEKTFGCRKDYVSGEVCNLCTSPIVREVKSGRLCSAEHVAGF
jgi:hypothetical protein